MNAITLGPLVFAADQYAAILGIFAFVLVAAILARRIDGRFHAWSSWALIGGGVAARAGHVLLHWRNFAEEPLRILAFWDGGFYWPAGLAAALLSVLLKLPTQLLRIWALLPLALALVVWNTAWQFSSGTAATALPASAFESLAGDKHSLAAGGNPKVINLWASWCPPCRREMPMMSKVAAASTGVEFVFANQGESRDVINRYLDDAGISLNTVLLDPIGDLAHHYGAPGLPATLFVGADGTLKHAHLGEISLETLQSRIAELQSGTTEEGNHRMFNRRFLLKATGAGLATAALPLPVFAQPELTVEEVLFDPQIPVLGNPKGDVTIAEYFDFQCPYCKSGHSDLLDAVKEDGKVRLVMKDWPIFGGPSVHASSLVLAAGKHYEKALQALMSTQGRLTEDDVDTALKKVGLDPEALHAAFKKDQARIDGILARNMDQANAFGFGGTPAFLVNTRVHHGAMNKQALRDSIAAARKG